MPQYLAFRISTVLSLCRLQTFGRAMIAASCGLTAAGPRVMLV
jgi:hypothetical protein